MGLLGRSPKQQAPEEIFLSNLSLIEKVTQYVCAGNRLSGPDADEFTSVVKLKLIENDYAILRKFQGRCALKTYLNTVITRLLIDQRVKEEGRWRPSMEAKRSGEAAVKLEELLYRKRYSLEEACEILITNHRFNVTRDELYAIAGRLPQRRLRQKHESEETLTGGAGASQAPDESNVHPKLAAQKEKVKEVVQGYILKLSKEDRLILKMRFESNCKVSEISSFLGLNQKKLYSCIEKILGQFRRELLSTGIPEKEILEIVERFDAEISIEFGVDNAEE